ncbi:hypothetical protein [Desulfonatronovibrio magnus]|uniref:hypothetical protein n=1 Tax=Desulfonatronovibrio magnus TaxID=698827 RepID=UPI0005EBB3E4|nr:hypothetical protein [Desulfonatronovibrio magnus]
MDINNVSKDDLKELIQEAFNDVLTKRKDILEDAVSEALLDIKFGLAMEEADNGEYATEKSVMDKLKT